MWNRVEAELTGLLESRIYRCLLLDRSEWGDVEYLRECLKKQTAVIDALRRPKMYPGFLFAAGILPEFPTKIEQLIPAQRMKLSEAARIHAKLIVGELSGLGALREQRAGAEVVTERKLFRLWDSRWPNSEAGGWWFSEGLYGQVRELPARERQAMLRDLMAVSRDWSNLDRVSSMKLVSHELPAIVALGLPQRYYSKGMWGRMEAGNAAEVVARRQEYFNQLGRTLAGGKTQFFLPWVPRYLVKFEGTL